MKTKIPPPILATLMIGLVYLSTLLFKPITFEYQEALSILIVIIGLACALSSFRLFSRHKTTISPFTPSETAVLLTEGMYRYSIKKPNVLRPPFTYYFFNNLVWVMVRDVHKLNFYFSYEFSTNYS